MLSAVSSVISGAGAELVVGGHGTMMTIVTNVAGLLYMYRTRVQVACTGVLHTASGPAPSPGDTSAGGTLAHVPTSGHQWAWPHPPCH